MQFLTLSVLTSLALTLSIQVCITHSSDSTSNTNFHNLTTCLLNNGVNSSNIIPRNSSDYADLNYQWNQYGGTKRPMSYLLAETIADIQKAVVCGKMFGIRVVPKCGGHSFAKYSYGDHKSFVIDLSRLNQVIIDHEIKTCNIEPGALIGHVALKLWKSANKVIPLGSCPTVGISFALGGGDGSLARLLGLTVDSVIELDMIDANGTILTANYTTNSDLFWALRGAGAASFGIVTRYKFKMHDAPMSVLYGTKIYELSMFPQVFYVWQLLFMSNPSKTINSDMLITRTKLVLHIYEVQNAEFLPAQSVFQDIFDSFPDSINSNSTSSIESLPYEDFLLKSTFFEPYKLSVFLNMTRNPTKPTFFKTKSFYSSRRLEIVDVWKLYEELRRIPAQNVNLGIYASGGAGNDVLPNETAYVHRNQTGYSVQIIHDGMVQDNIELARSLDWMRNFYDLSKVVVGHTESYQNYVDPELEDYLERYYGSNLNRLVDIKKRIDPDNYFWNAQSIPIPNSNSVVNYVNSSLFASISVAA